MFRRFLIKLLMAIYDPYEPLGANPTLRHLPIRLAKELEVIQDPYIHQIIVHLNTAIEDLYIINEHLNVPQLDELLRRRFPV